MTDMLFQATEHVPLDLIDIDDDVNPRKGKGLSQESIDQLALRMRTEGQITAVTLRPKSNGRYTLVAGYRRCKAALVIGWPTIRADIERADISPERSRIITHIENLDREQLSDYDRTAAAVELSTAQQIDLVSYAERTGVDLKVLRRHVAWYRTLPDTIKDGWRTGDPRATPKNLHRLAAMFPADAEREWHELAGRSFEEPEIGTGKKKKRRLARPSALKLERLMEVVQESSLPPDVRELVESVVAYAQGATNKPPVFPKKEKSVAKSLRKKVKKKK